MLLMNAKSLYVINCYLKMTKYKEKLVPFARQVIAVDENEKEIDRYFEEVLIPYLYVYE